jgi:chemotaxis signal transduction protein
MSAQILARLERMRRAFDASFAEPAATERPRTEQLVRIRAAQATVALRVGELTALQAGRRIVPVPGGPPELLGLAAAGGVALPAYDLASLLGLGRGQRSCRWLAVCGGADPIGLAFEELLGHLSAPASAFAPLREGASRPHARELLQLPSGFLPVVDLASLLGALRQRFGAQEASHP